MVDDGLSAPDRERYPSRLRRILDKISELARNGADPDSAVVDTGELASFMRELYGEEAVEKARALEKRSADRSFAQLVRVTIEALEREEARNAGSRP